MYPSRSARNLTPTSMAPSVGSDKTSGVVEPFQRLHGQTRWTDTATPAAGIS